MIAQVNAPYFRIATQFLRTSLPEYFPTFQNVRAIGDVQGFAHVMIGDEYDNARLRQAPNDLLQILHGERVNPREGLIQKYKRRLQGERTDGLEAHRGEQLFKAVALLFWSEWKGFQDGKEIFFAGQLPEDRGFLGQVADAVAGPQIHRKVSDFLAVEDDAAGVRPGESDDNVECRGL